MALTDSGLLLGLDCVNQPKRCIIGLGRRTVYNDNVNPLTLLLRRPDDYYC